MPRRPFTATQKAEISKRMKARWAKTRAQTAAATNGLSITTNIQLSLHGHEFVLSLGDARQLREALTAALVPTEPTHE